MGGFTELQKHELLDILTGDPPESAGVTTINFAEQGLPEYKDHFAIHIDNLFTNTECQALLASAEQSVAGHWEEALVNIGNTQQMLNTDIRLCHRILWDDHDVAAVIMKRVLPYLPSDIITMKDKLIITGKGPSRRGEVWRITRLNERLRFLKYTENMYFRPHCDGSYVTPDQKEVTFLTVHLYLNGGDDLPGAQHGTVKNQDEPLLGGATRFFSLFGENYWDFDPKTGSVLVFQHRNLVHSGEDVEQGTKFTMRSDILYRKVEDGDIC